jgi:hypothetical protein
MLLIRRSGMAPDPDDQEVGVMTSVSALVSDLDAELRRLGYKDSTMMWPGVPGGGWGGTSLPVACRSSLWTWRWHWVDDLPEWNHDPALLTWLASL